MYQGEDSESDDEVSVPAFYFPRKQNTRANAVKKLQDEWENEFVTKMCGSLQSIIQDDDGKVNGPPSSVSAVKFDPIELTKNCINSWRTERQAITVSIAESTKLRKSISDHNKKMTNNTTKKVTKYREEPSTINLNRFLQTLHQQIGEAAEELENVPRKKFVLKEEDIMRRPSQLTKLRVEVEGTDGDEVKDARKKTLEKLSKNCAYWMTYKSTPPEHRLAVEKELQEVHGPYKDDDEVVLEHELLNKMTTTSKNKSRHSLITEEPFQVGSLEVC